MQLMSESTLIDAISGRITELQTAHVALQEHIKQFDLQRERRLNDDALKIIDILDMIDMVRSHTTTDNSPHSNNPLIIKKIDKHLRNILHAWKVEEIKVTDNQIIAGKTRVIEARQSSTTISDGVMIEVCRKGYQRGDKIIRPTDVITISSCCDEPKASMG